MQALEEVKASVILPILNEEENLRAFLPMFKRLKGEIEFLFVDGGSKDSSQALILEHGFELLLSAPGRAKQMNHGARNARGRLLIFLHIDTQLPASFSSFINGLQHVDIEQDLWGFFTVQLSGKHWLLRWVESGINFRANLFNVATGDQCIFISRGLFDKVQGFASIPLMEDIELTRRLKRYVLPLRRKEVVITSSRRWEKKGILRTVILMWSIQLAYRMGCSPERLHRWYYSR